MMSTTRKLHDSGRKDRRSVRRGDGKACKPSSTPPAAGDSENGCDSWQPGSDPGLHTRELAEAASGERGASGHDTAPSLLPPNGMARAALHREAGVEREAQQSQEPVSIIAVDPAFTPEFVSQLNRNASFHTIEYYPGEPVIRRQLMASDLCTIDLTRVSFLCAPCFKDVRYRKAGQWVPIARNWSKLREARVKALLAIQLSVPLPLTKTLIARHLEYAHYAVSDDAVLQTITVLRKLLSGRGSRSWCIETHPGYETAYSWNADHGFVWVTLEPMYPALKDRHTRCSAPDTVR